MTDIDEIDMIFRDPTADDLYFELAGNYDKLVERLDEYGIEYNQEPSSYRNEIRVENESGFNGQFQGSIGEIEKIISRLEELFE